LQLFSLAAAPAQAILITGVTASSSFSTAFGSINNTLNGSGLPGDVPALTGNHSGNSSTNSWLGSGTTGNINFNLNGLYNLDGFSFWNFDNSDIAGINGVSILTSTDGVSYTVLLGAPIQFPIASSFGTTPAQQFTFAPTPASFVRFAVSSNYGAGRNTGFAEVQFSGTPTAVPFEFNPVSGLVVLGLGFGLSKLRKKAVIK
jgi:hypothetical protein